SVQSPPRRRRHTRTPRARKPQKPGGASADGNTRATMSFRSGEARRRSGLLPRRGRSGRVRHDVSVDEHKAQAPRSVRCFVITISDTRTEDRDSSGRAIVELLEAAGHTVAGRTIVKDDPELVRGTIERQLANPQVQVIITTGGTGITTRDSTYEAVCGLLQKKLDGFGELFRLLSYEQ